MRTPSVLPAIALAAVVMLTLTSVSPLFFADDCDADAYGYSGFYYDQLTDDGKKAYRTIVENAVPNAVGLSTVVDTGISNMEAQSAAVLAVVKDRQELFILDVTKPYEMSSTGEVTIQLSCTKEDYNTKMEKLNPVIDSINAKVAACAYDYEKVLTIHDYIVSNIVYTTGATDAHNIYGALIGNHCVCEGYARSMQYLCTQNGIECAVVSGTGINSSGSEGHMWNIIRLDGNWYCLDVTWDDPLVNGSDSGKVYYDYFLVGTDTVNDGRKFTESHVTTDYLPLLSSEPYYLRPGTTPMCQIEGTVVSYDGVSRFTADAAAIDAALAYLQNSGSAEVSFGDGKEKIILSSDALSKLAAYMAAKGESSVSFEVSSKEETVSVGPLSRENTVYRFAMSVGGTVTDLSEAGEGLKATLCIPYEASQFDLIQRLIFAWDVSEPMKPLTSSTYDGKYVSVDVTSFGTGYVVGSTPVKDVPVTLVIGGVLIVLILLWAIVHSVRKHRH